jgi:DNA-binding CsgD family transcriptional regulator
MNAQLTAREIDVVRLLAKGCTYSRIAQVLGISEHTVATHIKSVYRKLDVHTAAGAVFRALPLFVHSVEALGGSHGA